MKRYQKQDIFLYTLLASCDGLNDYMPPPAGEKAESQIFISPHNKRNVVTLQDNL